MLPLQCLEVSFSGLWKCRPTAELPFTASLARNTKPGYPWGFRDHQSTGKTYHSYSDTRLFPPWLLAAILVPARHCRQSPFCSGAVIYAFGWRQHKETCNTSGIAWRFEFVQRLSSALSGIPVKCSQGLLGYFSPVQTESIESLVATILC